MSKTPLIGYQYVTLAEHPDKLFRIRCEEVDTTELVKAFCPTQESIELAQHWDRNRHYEGPLPCDLPRKLVEPVNLVCMAPLSPPASTWARFRAWYIKRIWAPGPD